MEYAQTVYYTPSGTAIPLDPVRAYYAEAAQYGFGLPVKFLTSILVYKSKGVDLHDFGLALQGQPNSQWNPAQQYQSVPNQMLAQATANYNQLMQSLMTKPAATTPLAFIPPNFKITPF